ncbi:uncharacterized protein A1O5_07934 [Cladophialophora psammophila CBS 110553]|uniref:Uncharacterized protein n=1 Tax=Cladophialophora psammophila CBS 110553 TaxID=1182543 RepID=W9XF45_9EURO|nr:uncharacterized protein A1O5_07934 [Cladophialophora psammophila CBS 110553]EXJ68999.1 hypothetical protein A1O5_07934 [Cladophialophora psammophila CBS 110553]
MSVDETRGVLPNASGRLEMLEEHSRTTTLLQKLTYLRLAIVQAPSYISTTQETVNTYPELMDDLGMNCHPFFILFEQIRRHHRREAEFLSAVACLHEKDVPLSLLPELSSKKAMVDAIATLNGYSFVTSRSMGGIGSHSEPLHDIHRLVHIAARKWLKGNCTLPGLMKAFAMMVAWREPELGYLSYCNLGWARFR